MIAQLVACAVACVTVIGLVVAVVSALGGGLLNGRTERSAGLPPRWVRRKRLGRGSQQLRAIEAALAAAGTEPPSRCSVPRAHEQTRRR